MKSKIIILAIWISAACQIASAQTLESYLTAIAKNNPDLKILRQKMTASGYELDAANTLDATSIEYSPFFSRRVDGIASSELIVTQELDFPTLYAARSKSAKLQKEGMEYEYKVQLRDILFEGTQNYLQLVRRMKEHQNLARRLEALIELSRLADKRLAAGDITALEINRLKIQIMEIESSLVANESEALTIRNAMSALAGYTSDVVSPNGIGVDMNLTYPKWGIPSEPVNQLASNEATVKKTEADLKAVAQEEKVAKQGWLPKLTVGYRRNTDGNEAVNGFVVGAAFPLFATGKTVKAAKARKAAAVIAAENARTQTEKELENALSELRLIERSMSTYDLTLLDETQTLMIKSVEHGQMTFSDYITESIQLNEKRIAYLDLEYAYYQKLSLLYRNTL